MSSFVREPRYYVAKFKDIEAALTPSEILQLDSLMNKIDESRISQNKAPIEAVVVESDWPEFEEVWGMIRDRSEGRKLVGTGDYVTAVLLSGDATCQGVYLGPFGRYGAFTVLSETGEVLVCIGSPVHTADENLSVESLSFVTQWREQINKSKEGQ